MTAPEQLVTDGGLETDLIFHHGIDLPHLAAFPLLGDRRWACGLSGYFEDYLDDRRARSAWGFVPRRRPGGPTPTGPPALGYAARRAWPRQPRRHRPAASACATRCDRPAAGGGQRRVGPRSDGYRPVPGHDHRRGRGVPPRRSRTLAEAGRRRSSRRLTLTYAAEAVGIVRRARAAGMPVAISFTVETDGRLPTGDHPRRGHRSGRRRHRRRPALLLVNCAHPDALRRRARRGRAAARRIRGLRANSSTMSHAELDEATELDALMATGSRWPPTTPPAGALAPGGGDCWRLLRTHFCHVAALWRDRAVSGGMRTEHRAGDRDPARPDAARSTAPGGSPRSPWAALVAAAGFRSSTGALLEPLESEFGWSRATTSGAVSLTWWSTA